MNVQKIRVQLLLDADDFNAINRYGEAHGLRNVSQAVTEMLREWRRFKNIALKMQKDLEIEALSKAEVIRNEGKEKSSL